jgi:hypothetical protein
MHISHPALGKEGLGIFSTPIIIEFNGPRTNAVDNNYYDLDVTKDAMNDV